MRLRAAIGFIALFLTSITAMAESQTRVLVLSPQASTRPNETHAALALSKTSFSGDIKFRGRIQTVQQLRIGTPPNPWECAWLVWTYQAHRFYYVALKTNGWEIGKFDHDLHRKQKFLKTGEGSYAPGTWHDFEIEQKRDEIRVSLDGVEVATFRDVVRPYTAGKIGFYTEDAEIHIDRVTSPFSDDFEDYPVQKFQQDGQALKNWFMPFLGHGYAAVVTREK